VVQLRADAVGLSKPFLLIGRFEQKQPAPQKAGFLLGNSLNLLRSYILLKATSVVSGVSVNDFTESLTEVAVNRSVSNQISLDMTGTVTDTILNRLVASPCDSAFVSRSRSAITVLIGMER
jgi:hypothetical protein